jgi:hypothetical protein
MTLPAGSKSRHDAVLSIYRRARLDGLSWK